MPRQLLLLLLPGFSPSASTAWCKYNIISCWMPTPFTGNYTGKTNEPYAVVHIAPSQSVAPAVTPVVRWPVLPGLPSEARASELDETRQHFGTQRPQRPHRFSLMMMIIIIITRPCRAVEVKGGEKHEQPLNHWPSCFPPWTGTSYRCQFALVWRLRKKAIFHPSVRCTSAKWAHLQWLTTAHQLPCRVCFLPHPADRSTITVMVGWIKVEISFKSMRSTALNIATHFTVSIPAGGKHFSWETFPRFNASGDVKCLLHFPRLQRTHSV